MTQELKAALIRNKKPLLLAFGLAAVVTFFLGSSFLSLVHNKLEMRKLARQRVQLDNQHEELLAKMKLLGKQDPAYIEELARTQYNMVKPGEIEFRFHVK